MSIIEKAIAKLNQANQENIHAENGIEEMPKVDKSQSAYSELQLKFNVETVSAAGIVSPNKQAPYLADEFRHIKRPLLNNAFGGASELVESGNVVMVTSSLPGEGKSFTAANLALSIALEKDYTVLLIDADVTISKITRMFALENRPGLTNKLENTELDLADMLIKTDFPGLSILPSGKQTPLATELLSSKVMKELVKDMATRYNNRIIIFDSPPLLATPESAVLAEQMGQIVVVVEANKTPQSAVLNALSMLNKEKAINLVLNKTSPGFGYRQYGDYSHYGYHAESTS